LEKAFLIRLAIAVLVAATFFSLPLRPLWVDEIYQLEATRDLPVSQILHSSMIAPGGMPLGYLVQTAWLRLAGFSRSQARFPAALFGLGAVFITAWIARQLLLSASLATVLGLLTPILFRYSTEARPYSQGLFFSTLSTAVFLTWLTNPCKWKWFAYLLCNVAGIYSQPFSIFIPVAHAIYLLLFKRARLFPVCSAIALTGAAYLPWFLLSQRALQHEAWLNQMFFSWRQVSPLVIIKEISGGGYVCSVSMLLLIAASLKKTLHPLLLCCTIVPAVLAIGADAKFNYFFAIRQLIFIVPPLLLLAVAAVDYLWQERKTTVALLMSAYITGAVVKDVNWQRDHKEDWAKAASAIEAKLQITHGCVSFAPPRDAHAYYFFKPALRVHTCDSSPHLVNELLAVSPYASASERHLAGNAENVGNTLIVARAY
jgi:4-amino-4-deoxy-L-arabinose transferase-like glycosyltransferase